MFMVHLTHRWRCVVTCSMYVFLRFMGDWKTAVMILSSILNKKKYYWFYKTTPSSKRFKWYHHVLPPLPVCSQEGPFDGHEIHVKVPLICGKLQHNMFGFFLPHFRYQNSTYVIYLPVAPRAFSAHALTWLCGHECHVNDCQKCGSLRKHRCCRQNVCCRIYSILRENFCYLYAPPPLPFPYYALRRSIMCGVASRVHVSQTLLGLIKMKKRKGNENKLLYCCYTTSNLQCANTVGFCLYYFAFLSAFLFWGLCSVEVLWSWIPTDFSSNM